MADNKAGRTAAKRQQGNGNTSGVSGYDLESYSLISDGGSTFSRYNATDGKTVFGSEDDAATANWGADWRMPTYSEMNELVNKCEWIWTTYNGVEGRKVTSKFEGYTDVSIFLPAAGYRSGVSLGRVGYRGYYWSSSLNSYYSSNACSSTSMIAASTRAAALAAAMVGLFVPSQDKVSRGSFEMRMRLELDY